MSDQELQDQNLNNNEGEAVEVDAELEGENKTEAELAEARSSALKERKMSVRRAEDEELEEEGEGQLTIDVYQTSDEIIIESPIAGVRPENLDVSITTESVTITGKREKERKVKEEDYFYQECYWGRFSRSIILPQEVDAEKAEATVKNGVLTIRLPKLNRQRSKKLKVQSE